MGFRALACDYDGTLATAGAIAPATMAALRRVRDSGRRVLLVTGRRLDDLLVVCPELSFFDLVVAENGAILLEPRGGRVDVLGEPPPAAFLGALARAGVPFVTGRVIVATVVPHEVAVLETMRHLGLELQIAFNRDAVMVLPRGVSKATGLARALEVLALSAADTIGVGDAENDRAFLACTGLAVAVANAVPSLAAVVHVVTTAPNGAGVCELVERLLAGALSVPPPRPASARQER